MLCKCGHQVSKKDIEKLSLNKDIDCPNCNALLGILNLKGETIMNGSFISVWEEGTIQTEGTLDIETGEVTCKSVNTPDLGCLEREYFEDKDGNEYEVCKECHEYILKTAMVPGISHTLEEEQYCSNPDCG